MFGSHLPTIETLEEIDCEYQELARESGITNWERVPALGLEPTFIDDLAEAVVEVRPRTTTCPVTLTVSPSPSLLPSSSSSRV